MNKINFHFDGVDLQQDEAALILGSKDDLRINISSFVKALDYQQLFELAISKKNPELANLAAKIGMAQSKSTLTAPRIRKTKSTEDIIEQCCTRHSFKNIGIATLLMFGSDEKITMKHAALDAVYEFHGDESIPLTSKCFLGFQSDKLGNIEPIEGSGKNRDGSYYVCPMYISLLQGMKFMRSHDLVNVEERWSFGGANASQQASTTQRKYYVYSLTDSGKAIKEEWSDILEYIKTYWRTNLTSSTALKLVDQKAS